MYLRLLAVMLHDDTFLQQRIQAFRMGMVAEVLEEE